MEGVSVVIGSSFGRRASLREPADCTQVEFAAEADVGSDVLLVTACIARQSSSRWFIVQRAALTFTFRRKGNAITAIEAQLIGRLKKLPPSRVAEVVDFVEFLSQREERAAAAQRLTAGLARRDALNLPQVTEDEVEAEIQLAWQERSSKQDA
jgi:hypothetical protein